MLSEAEMAKVRAQRHKMAEIMKRDNISLFGPPPSPTLQDLILRINAGEGFTPEDLARMEEIGNAIEDENS